MSREVGVGMTRCAALAIPSCTSSAYSWSIFSGTRFGGRCLATIRCAALTELMKCRPPPVRSLAPTLLVAARGAAGSRRTRLRFTVPRLRFAPPGFSRFSARCCSAFGLSHPLDVLGTPRAELDGSSTGVLQSGLRFPLHRFRPRVGCWSTLGRPTAG